MNFIVFDLNGFIIFRSVSVNVLFAYFLFYSFYVVFAKFGNDSVTIGFANIIYLLIYLLIINRFDLEDSLSVLHPLHLHAYTVVLFLHFDDPTVLGYTEYQFLPPANGLQMNALASGHLPFWLYQTRLKLVQRFSELSVLLDAALDLDLETSIFLVCLVHSSDLRFQVQFRREASVIFSPFTLANMQCLTCFVKIL